MNTSLQLGSIRAKKARLARRIGRTGYRLLVAAYGVLFVLCIALLVTHRDRLAFLSLAPALLSLMLAIWYHRDLSVLPPSGSDLTDRLSGDVLARLIPSQAAALTPQQLWDAVSSNYQCTFFINRLVLPGDLIKGQLSTIATDTEPVWVEAARQADLGGSQAIEPGHITAALLLSSPGVLQLLKVSKLSGADVQAIMAWLGRALDTIRGDKPYFGGIGRDWAHGFTPQLNRFGTNISLAIEHNGGHYDWLAGSDGVRNMKNAFSQGASALALIGPDGIGKTSHVYALAQSLLAEQHDRNLEHRQIVGLNPSLIISSSPHAGQLERLVISLLSETLHAGHIILFFDDAQQFFGDGHGAVDLTQILLPILQNKRLQCVFAMTPNDFQALKAKNSAFAALLTPVILSEPSEQDVMRVLEDSSLGLEAHHQVNITYEGLREAYRLSGRYENETAYPGKAIQLLEQSLPHAEHGMLTGSSVEQAIQQTRGVKVGSAKPVEAQQLLHLEDKIHERMINQKRAVQVVSAALRRARAGVSNPNRPIGSFLFLGPTGVGKTELAKAIAATYFGAETNMVRLDMSEYQQSEDANRLLSDGSGASTSLIMAVRQQPFCVLLLDEVEKAHPNILNLLLQLLDEGKLTDNKGRAASFKDCIIIATSNAGANQIREHVEKGEALEDFEGAFVDELIKSNQFKPELLNRFDEIVLFRPLSEEELVQVVGLMMKGVNATLAAQNITVTLSDAAAKKLAAKGYDPRLGARPMRRMLQRTVQDTVANKILSGEIQAGDKLSLDEGDIED